MGKIVTVGNLKGGTGKSTVAVNVACALARSPERAVLLIDADAQATASDWLRERPPRVDLLPLPLMVARDAEAWVARVIELRAGYDVVVVDLPPQVGSGIASALLLSDLFVVPVTPSGADLRATGKALDLLRRARERRGGDGDGGGDRPACMLIPSKVDRRTAVGRRATALLDRFGLKVGPAIRQRSAHVEAFDAGQWVGAYAPDGAAHAEIRAVAGCIERMLGLGPATERRRPASALPPDPEPDPTRTPPHIDADVAAVTLAPVADASARAAGAGAGVAAVSAWGGGPRAGGADPNGMDVARGRVEHGAEPDAADPGDAGPAGAEPGFDTYRDGGPGIEPAAAGRGAFEVGDLGGLGIGPTAVDPAGSGVRGATDGPREGASDAGPLGTGSALDAGAMDELGSEPTAARPAESGARPTTGGPLEGVKDAGPRGTGPASDGNGMRRPGADPTAMKPAGLRVPWAINGLGRHAGAVRPRGTEQGAADLGAPDFGPGEAGAGVDAAPGGAGKLAADMPENASATDGPGASATAAFDGKPARDERRAEDRGRSPAATRLPSPATAGDRANGVSGAGSITAGLPRRATAGNRAESLSGNGGVASEAGDRRARVEREERRWESVRAVRSTTTAAAPASSALARLRHALWPGRG